MNKKSYCLVVVILLFCSRSSIAQVSPKIIFKELLQTQVSENSQSLLNPFCGGINSTQPTHADLNNDGKNDLVIYDQNTETIKTFINVGLSGEEKYRYTPKYVDNFPKIKGYLKLIDYNCDSIPDLFHRGSAGINVNIGYYNANNELAFTHYKELWYPGAQGPENAYVRGTDIPIIKDLDGDGDTDFASFTSGGGFLYYYRNLRIEDNLPCDSIRIILEDPCLGSMTQPVLYRTHNLNQVCKGISGSNKKYRHAGNCLLSMDINGSGLNDLIIGNISFNDAQILMNTGSTSNTYFSSQDTLFDLDGHQLEIFSWVAPFYFDIDNDNDKDLVFTPHIDNISTANYNVMAVYENIGTTASPNFIWRNDSAFVTSMIDVGRNSYPTLFDYDKDGKVDLFVGGSGYFNTNTQQRISQIAYYRNTSTPGNVSFELITRDFLNISSRNYNGIHPTFGDLTGDGIEDLILGNEEGSLVLFKNNAPNNSSTPNFVWQTDSIPGIDVGAYSYPVVYDFNNDGKTDLLVGCELGTIWLYVDTSMTTVKELKRIDSAAGNIKVGSVFDYFSYGVPFIGSVDSTNKKYLLVGTTTGDIERYDNFTNNYSNWTRIDSNMAQLHTANSAAPAIADLDGDQRPELLLGNQNGGLQLYQFVRNTSVGTTNITKSDNAIRLYPNPSSSEIRIKMSTSGSFVKQYRILDISGRVVQEKIKRISNNEGIYIGNLSDGLYFIETVFENNSIGKGKFIKSE